MDQPSKIDIGFCEEKPHRVPYPASSKDDRAKVISAMESAIMHLWNTNVSPEVMRQLVTIGVICNGMILDPTYIL